MVGSSQLKEVLDSIVQGAMEFPDPSVRPYVGDHTLLASLVFIQGQKICFGILKKLLECWGECCDDIILIM